MSADREIRSSEVSLEQKVSEYIGSLLFTYIDIPDVASPKSLRAIMERDLINVLTADSMPLEIPSARWLGSFSSVEKIRSSGLWNIQHVATRYDERAIDRIANLIENPRLRGL